MVRLILDEAYRIAVASELTVAKKNIRIMMFRIQRKVGYGKNEGNIYGFWLKKKASQGVKVKIILDITRRPGMPYKENYHFAREMTSSGVECRELKNRRVCHAKMVIVDETTMIIGSHNWTTNSIKRNLEASIKIKDNYIVREAVEAYDRIFSGAVVFT